MVWVWIPGVCRFFIKMIDDQRVLDFSLGVMTEMIGRRVSDHEILD
jgi:hypothetical protein